MDQQQEQMGNLWLPIVAAVGAGAATFYTMTRKNGQNQNMFQQVSSLAQNLTNQQQGKNQ